VIADKQSGRARDYFGFGDPRTQNVDFPFRAGRNERVLAEIAEIVGRGPDARGVQDVLAALTVGVVETVTGRADELATTDY